MFQLVGETDQIAAHRPINMDEALDTPLHIVKTFESTLLEFDSNAQLWH